MLLIYPPLARSTEPPLGIARLKSRLALAGIEARCLDLCQEGYEYLLSLDFDSGDTWSRGALKRRERNLSFLRGPEALGNPAGYRRAIGDLNRCLKAVSEPRGLSVSLTDYRDSGLSPSRTADLVKAAARWRESVFLPLFERRLRESVPGHDEIGISLCFLSQALPAFALMGFIRARYPGTRVILGGSLLTSWTRQGLVSPAQTFGGLVDALLPGRGGESLVSLLGGKPIPEEGPDPGGAPDFSDFEGLEYFSPLRILPYDFSSGCPWLRCRFCPEVAEGNPYHGIAPGLASREIGRIAQRHNPAMLHFTDSEIGPAYLRMLAETGPGLPWYGFARFSSLLLDPGFCQRLSASGCAMLQLGLESGDQGVLDALGKGTDLGDIRAILLNLKAAGIAVYAYLLFGTRAENERSARRTLSFVEANAGSIDFLNVAIFNLPASSPELAGLRTRAFSEGDLSLYREFSHPEGWNRDAVRAFLSKEFEACPAVRPILSRTPASFGSNHAAFFAAPAADRWFLRQKGAGKRQPL
jgi:hypothetical protein